MHISLVPFLVWSHNQQHSQLSTRKEVSLQAINQHLVMTEVYGSTNALGNKGTSLSSIYQARKSGERTVNVLKKQFQDEVWLTVRHPDIPICSDEIVL